MLVYSSLRAAAMVPTPRMLLESLFGEGMSLVFPPHCPWKFCHQTPVVKAILMEYEKAVCMCGYHHIYKDIWKVVSGKETLVCILKPGNTHDQYAVAVGTNRTVKGHLPWKVLLVCALCLKKGGHICYRLTGQQRYSVDLRQGGIRVELRYSGVIFNGSNFSWCFSFCVYNFHG